MTNLLGTSGTMTLPWTKILITSVTKKLSSITFVTIFIDTKGYSGSSMSECCTKTIRIFKIKTISFSTFFDQIPFDIT